MINIYNEYKTLCNEYVGSSNRITFDSLAPAYAAGKIINTFRGKYMLLVFPQKIPIKKYTDVEEDLKEGDVVQVVGENVAARNWRLAVVCSVMPRYSPDFMA
jgi:hypothetical protein